MNPDDILTTLRVLDDFAEAADRAGRDWLAHAARELAGEIRAELPAEGRA